ncbi:hypothetical protein LMG33810_002426 [Carnimonas sp. LMG 33810]
MNRSTVQIITPRGSKYLSARFPIGSLPAAAARYGWTIDNDASKRGVIVLIDWPSEESPRPSHQLANQSKEKKHLPVEPVRKGEMLIYPDKETALEESRRRRRSILGTTVGS